MERTAILVLTTCFICSCADDEAPVLEETTAALQVLDDCDAAAEELKTAALQHMNEQLDANLRAVLNGTGRLCYDFEDARNGAAEQTGTAGSPGTVSGTNNQVVGVDEADFVKTTEDGRLYVVSHGKLRIIEAWPVAQARVLATLEIEGEPKKLFIHGSRALVYSSLSDGPSVPQYEYYWEPRECTYGYHCDFTGDGHPTKLTVVDTSVPTAPVVVRETWLSGSLVSARRIEDTVFSVVTDNEPTFDGVAYWPESINPCGGDVSDLDAFVAFEQLRARNTAIIQSTDVQAAFPQGQDSIHGTMTGDCSGFYATTFSAGSAFTTVVSVDMSADRPAALTSIISRPGAVYASPNALYMSVPYYGSFGYWGGGERPEQVSTVHKFALDTSRAEASYRASGVVKGRVLNQFGMDEYDGHLRIATTSGWTPDPEVHSTLTILGESGGNLVQLGVVDNIAPTEDIRSVRFSGDRGFIVTFKKTDPLFALNLTDPTQPRIEGELKIPGYSTYMHMMDADHLLTIGYDSNDQGSFAWFTGVMLQIFDVSNMQAPTLTHKTIIGTRGSSSEALTNHLAFTYYPIHDALALPMTICEGGSGGGSYGDTMTFSGLMVFETTVDAGFSEMGRVAHPAGEDVHCSNWWTQANSQVKRSVFMDDYVFSISDTLIKGSKLDNLATDLVVLRIDD